ncbi:hypothetical protein BST61_g2538 [Cercospora zeina]
MHQTRYPNARFETLRCCDTKQPKDANYARSRGKVLLHIFGHEAVDRVCSFLRTHYAMTGSVLDVEALIFDEPPSSTSWTTSMRPGRALWNVGVWVISWASWVLDEPPYDRDTWIRHDLQDSRLLPQSTRLHYVRNGERALSDSGGEDAGMGTGYAPGLPLSKCSRLEDVTCC